MEIYPSDLTDAEWAILEPLIPPGKPGGRPRQVDMRAVLNAIFYLLRAGCAWRMLPRDCPPRSTVYGYFALFRDGAIWEQIMTVLRERCRLQAGRDATPSAGIIDSQSVKATERGGPHGYDGAKKSMAARGTSWSIRRAWFSKESSMLLISKIGKACRYSSGRSKGCFLA